MSERAKKSIGQDLVGVVFCILGVYFGVSILLHLFGQEPVVAFATRPVLELVALLGPIAALVLALGVAGIGAWIFLSSAPPAAGRPLATLALGAAGVAFVAGAFAHGGSLGDVFPGLVSGTPGRLIGAVLGVALGWLALTLLPARRSGSSTADVMRAGLGSRGDLAAGVSAAEAALLVSDTRPVARPAPKRAEPVRAEAPRPSAPAAVALPAPIKERTELPAPVAPSWEADEPETAPAAARFEAPVPEPGAAEPVEEEDADEQALAAELAEALTQDDVGEEEDEEEAQPLEEAAPAASTPPVPAWEQVGLFDEEDEEAEPAEAPPAAPAPVTPAFAFEDELRPHHEPERATADDPFAAEPVSAPARAEPAAELEEPEEDDADELEEEETSAAEEESATQAELAPTPAPTPAPAARPEFVLQPRPAVRAEPVVVRDGERERWERLVFDSGVLILEQKRVAVSMLERRFGIDFDSACKVLDELQQAGLIGPYIGGRTREILLTREQWLAQAPQTA